jgi:PhnB protein
VSFHPYLFFSGSCREAFTRYHEIFGGELALVTSADMPADEQMPGAAPDAIMHAAVTTADGSLLMGSDDPTSDTVTVQGVRVNISVSGVDEVTRIFDALAEGGEINAPLGPTSFAAAFGMVTDRFGIPWLLTTDEAPDAA